MAKRIQGVVADQQTAAMRQSYPYIGGGAMTGWTSTPAPGDEYANRVEVKRREHDATLTFYRDGDKAGKRVACIIVPLALLNNILVS